MKFEIQQEAMTVILCILIAVCACIFVKGCWDYKTDTRIAEIERGDSQ